jgi:hypothetical protein
MEIFEHKIALFFSKASVLGIAFFGMILFSKES